ASRTRRTRSTSGAGVLEDQSRGRMADQSAALEALWGAGYGRGSAVWLPVVRLGGVPTALLVMDVQQGFLNQFTAHIPTRLTRLIQRRQYDPILLTRFINTSDSPYRRMLNWHDCQDGPATELAA